MRTCIRHVSDVQVAMVKVEPTAHGAITHRRVSAWLRDSWLNMEAVAVSSCRTGIVAVTVGQL